MTPGFEPGKQVVCVTDEDWFDSFFGIVPPRTPVKGGVYTIDSIVNNLVFVGGVCIVLCEFDELCPDGAPRGWAACYFRPVKPTNIEVFRDLLVDPPRQLIDA